MWILCALISASILASRKIQEKQLVGEGGQAIGWMLRIGSVTSAFILWIVFSGSFLGIGNHSVWWVFLYSAIAYPASVFLYLKAIHELPLSIFGMLAPFALVVSLFCGWLFFGDIPSFYGLSGVILIGLGLIALFWKRERGSIHIKPILFALGSYSLMGLGYSMDKIALTQVDTFLYALINQSIALICLGLMNFYFLSGLKIPFFKKNLFLILIIGLLQGGSYYLSMYAVLHSPNVGYATALINSHAIITALYGIFILKEGINRRKILVFLCMTGAILAFAFA